jgi:hypothetical protein
MSILLQSRSHCPGGSDISVTEDQGLVWGEWRFSGKKTEVEPGGWYFSDRRKKQSLGGWCFSRRRQKWNLGDDLSMKEDRSGAWGDDDSVSENSIDGVDSEVLPLKFPGRFLFDDLITKSNYYPFIVENSNSFHEHECWEQQKVKVIQCGQS